MNGASPFLALAITAAARIEDRLRTLGGDGNGLVELATTLRPPLSSDLLGRIRQVAAVRNKLAHEPDYFFDGDEAQFLTLCETTLWELDATSSENLASVRTSASQHPEGPMDTNYWVEVDRENIVWNAYRSSRDRRLVFFKGSGVEVKPIGNHTVPWLGSPDAIGLVTLLPRQIALVPETELPTREGVMVEVKAVANIAVLDEEGAIARVALDAAHQETLVRSILLKAVQMCIASSEYESLRSGWAGLAEKVLAAITDGASVQTKASGELSFRVIDVLFTHLKATDSSLQNFAQHKARQEALDWELKQKKELADAEIDFDIERRRKLSNFEREQRRADNEEQRQHMEHLAKLVASEAGRLVHSPEIYKEIKIAEIKSEVEVARANRQAEMQVTKFAWEHGFLKGQNEMAKKMLPGMRNVTENININSSGDVTNPFEPRVDSSQPDPPDETRHDRKDKR